MKRYLQQIETLKNIFTPLQGEHFEPATDGTHYKVFLSHNYVIRFRDDNPDLLLREVDLLKHLEHPLIPNVLWVGNVNESITMVENRLLGQTVNKVWKTLPEISKATIIEDVVGFLHYLRTQPEHSYYSINTGKTYTSYLDYLTADVEQKVATIQKFEQAKGLLQDLLSIIKEPKNSNLFSNGKTALIHGDLIIHNLLTDGDKLTGVLDWELALFGDPDHDLFRLFYYLECAKAYQEQDTDESFEADYMDALIAAIKRSDIIENEPLFQKKYKFVRAIFYLNALNWASNSNNPEKNIAELVNQWGK
ncbi:hypothetical protein A2524_02860 [Candidatus Wolfebacteria bacterium RIFOXYD12_FULL_48_21]|nr:MAG: hypothetical protein A2524_02860 [Candidatus Wolfebacteria bacterium RIFOXYD12_FULL_48_21]OGM96790.1 MAG: hypothetical protein A2532_02685 [Candidatus Wolfebacteria bacterium RIFOXYD2_FULL_48_11]